MQDMYRELTITARALCGTNMLESIGREVDVPMTQEAPWA
jgi:hypothetical protein